MFYLSSTIIEFVLVFIDIRIGIPVLGILYALGVALPSLAVTVRRLHDTSHSGWWVLIDLVPLVGALVLLVFVVTESDDGENEYGPSPEAAG